MHCGCSLEHHVRKVIQQQCFYQQRNTTKISLIQSFSDVDKIIHAFIQSHLDYCNTLFTCLNSRAIEQLKTSKFSSQNLVIFQSPVELILKYYQSHTRLCMVQHQSICSYFFKSLLFSCIVYCMYLCSIFFLFNLLCCKHCFLPCILVLNNVL